MNSLQNIVILPFQPKYQSEAKNLILAGLAEHWGALDQSKNPDLDNISSSYSNGMFLVALQDNKIIGTGAIIPKSNNSAEIVRMSVIANMRRNGIGRMILSKLCEYAKSKGYKRVVLETTENWHEVIEFYKRFGFQITHYLDGDVYFALDL
jgi:ribosomal protein S18 acetylase RimI-like enzyme